MAAVLGARRRSILPDSYFRDGLGVTEQMDCPARKLGHCFSAAFDYAGIGRSPLGLLHEHSKS